MPRPHIFSKRLADRTQSTQHILLPGLTFDGIGTPMIPTQAPEAPCEAWRLLQQVLALGGGPMRSELRPRIRLFRALGDIMP
eukprot:14281408-Alexandrium_andersonii.AAC.1